MKHSTLFVVILLVLVEVSGCVPSKAEVVKKEVDQRTPVEVMLVATGTLVIQGNFHGALEPYSAVIVSAEAGGLAQKITVDKGSIIGPGKLILALEEEPYRLAEEQATKNLETTRVRVELLEKAITMERKSLEAGLDQARATVDMAQARLRMVENGARPEEKLQARAGKAAAKAGLDNAGSEYARIRDLFEAGAATRQMLDGAKAGLESGEARYDQSVQIYRLAVKGAREEDKDAASAGVKQAEAAMARATAGLDSLEVREKELEITRMGVSSAQLAVEHAQYNRSKATLESPLKVPAEVSTRMIDEGEMVSPGMPIVELLDLNRVKLVLQVPGRDIAHLKKGQKIPVRCIGDADDAAQRQGEVTYVGVKANPKNTAFPVEIVLDNSASDLRAGLICEAFPELASHNDILVPRSSVLDTEDGKVVIVAKDGIAREVPVRILAVREGIAAIDQGLEPGTPVIVVGERLVKDGEEVNVVNEQPAVNTESSE